MKKSTKKSKKKVKREGQTVKITVTCEQTGVVLREYSGIVGYLVSMYDKEDMKNPGTTAFSRADISLLSMQLLGVAAAKYASEIFNPEVRKKCEVTDGHGRPAKKKR